jgi:ABC-type dipeptide/oligopeptide/nickel transport system permease subunit
MKSLRYPAGVIAAVILGLLYMVAALAPCVTRHSFETQLRTMPDAGPSVKLPLGTDSLGRDRWSRFVYGSRISLFLAPAAALLACLLALLTGVAITFMPPRVGATLLTGLDLFLGLPWIFALIIARSLLPLEVAAELSLGITFLLLSMLGWPVAARAIRAGTVSLKQTDFYFQAIACGPSPVRVVFVQLLPNLRPVILAQFLTSVPAFIIAESTLGMLGLGVSEPLPSWGSQLLELQNYRLIPQQPWVLVPVMVMITAIWSLNQLADSRGSR